MSDPGRHPHEGPDYQAAIAAMVIGVALGFAAFMATVAAFAFAATSLQF